jgi:hyperosmotically inducible periplasmic protein
MFRKAIASSFALVALTVAAPCLLAQNGISGQSPAEMRIAREVRHEIVMLPYLDVFDYIAFKVDGNDVTLTGAVTNPTVKSDAEHVVKKIEGVQHVDSQIQVLPPSPTDRRIRLALFRAIYAYPPLQKYALSVVKPIRIIVNMGHVTLEGVVDSDADKNLVQLRANSVPGTFSVTNNLQVVKP